jgi:hypothetical protein
MDHGVDSRSQKTIAQRIPVGTRYYKEVPHRLCPRSHHGQTETGQSSEFMKVGIGKHSPPLVPGVQMLQFDS